MLVTRKADYEVACRAEHGPLRNKYTAPVPPLIAPWTRRPELATARRVAEYVIEAGRHNVQRASDRRPRSSSSPGQAIAQSGRHASVEEWNS